MNLTDVMSGAGLAFYAQIALVLFFLVFAVIVIRTWRRPRDEMDECAKLPMDEQDEHR